MKVFTLKTCDTCRKATKWLRENQIDFEEIPIRENPPSIAQLRTALVSTGGDIRKLFNTSGQDYRQLGLNARLLSLTEEQALELLGTNGNLVKRPFLIVGKTALVGFRVEDWQDRLI